MGASTDFHSVYRHGLVRVAACTTRCTLADPSANVVGRVGALDPNDARIEALVKLLRAHRGRGRRPTKLRRSIEEWRTSANV